MDDYLVKILLQATKEPCQPFDTLVKLTPIEYVPKSITKWLKKGLSLISGPNTYNSNFRNTCAGIFLNE